MVQILPREPSLSELIGSSIGQGVGQGVGQSSQMMQQLMMKQALQQQKASQLSQILGYGTQPGATQNNQGSVDQSQGMNLSPQQVVALAAIDPQFATAAASAANLSQRQHKQAFEEEKFGLQQTKELRKDLNEGYRTALENEKTYDAMEKLNEKDLAGPWQAYISEHLGLPISKIGNPESEQWQKLEQSLTRQISNFYPGQIRVVEFQSFLKQIPTLMNSKEGRTRILNTLRSLDEIKKIQFKTYREIVNKNKGKIPLDIDDQLSEKMADTLETVGKKLDKAVNPDKRILMMSPNGVLGEVSSENLEMAKSKGYTLYGR